MVAEKTIPSMAERVIAIHVSEDEYMRDYAEHFYEWVDGVVIKMSPVTAKHDGLSVYLRQLLDTYFALRPIGKVRSEPFVMKADNSPPLWSDPLPNTIAVVQAVQAMLNPLVK